MVDNAKIHLILHAGQDIVLCGDLINIMSGESPEPAQNKEIESGNNNKGRIIPSHHDEALATQWW